MTQKRIGKWTPLRVEVMTGLEFWQVTALIGQLGQVVVWPAGGCAGRPKELPLDEAVVMVLTGLRHDLCQELTGALFGCSQETVSRYHSFFEPLIERLLDPAVRTMAEQIKQEVKDHAQEVFVDGFLALVCDWQDQDGLYSGKHKNTGQNVQVVATGYGTIADVGLPCGGSMHDSKAFVASGIAARWAEHHTGPHAPGMAGDKAYQGTGIDHPHKKPRGGELTDAQKEENRQLNSVRAAVERCIAHLKNWKILKLGYRRPLEDFPRVLRLVTSLEFYRTYGLGFA